MTDTQLAINIAAYAIFTLAAAIAWPHRMNVGWTTQAAFFITAHLIPFFLLDFDTLSDLSAISILTEQNAIGAAAMCCGIYIAKRLPKKYGERPIIFPQCEYITTNPTAEKKATLTLLLGIMGMIFCFAWMGMIPAFAEDPFSAKFFKGPYKDRYDQVSMLYRLAQFGVITVLPLAMSFGLERRRPATVLASLAAMVVLGASLTRAPVLEGAMLIAAIKLSNTRKQLAGFLAASVITYVIGSAAYAIIGLTQNEGSFLEEAAAGAPDILDHLAFIRQFDPRIDLSYGLTFVGGLIPGNFQYNPAIFSLAISNPLGDPTESASGGFRMPPSLWGYAAFGTPGTVLTCLASGILLGIFSRGLQRIASAGTLCEKVAIALWFKNVAMFFIGFYSMFYFGLLSIGIFWALTRDTTRVGKARAATIITSKK